MEWTIGITDLHPRQWKKKAPRWTDESISVPAKTTLHAVMNKLCETALANRREHDYDIDDHLWRWKIHASEEAYFKYVQRDSLEVAMFGEDESSDESDEESDEQEEKYRGVISVTTPDELNHLEAYDFDDGHDEDHKIPSTQKISTSILPQGCIIEVIYDYGNTTTLYLKVLTAQRTVVTNLLTYFNIAAGVEELPEDQEKDLKAVPAYSLPAEQQIDAFYPNFSKAFLGYYVPLVERDQENNEQGRNNKRKALGSCSWGLSSKRHSEDDTTFLTMEDASKSRDLCFSPLCFQDLDEFLTVAEEAWRPRKKDDADQLSRYKYSFVVRYVLPSGPKGDEFYEGLKDAEANDEMAMFGSKVLYYRLEDTNTKRLPFNFASVFPKTHAMLVSSGGKFRWFQHQNNILRVVVGRGVGHMNRDMENEQILRTWKREFTSLHELLCAVEASWFYQGEPLSPDTELPDFDADLSPSHPKPKEPEVLGDKDTMVTIYKGQSNKMMVTALAIVEENGETMLYSGHMNGTLTKWSLEEGDGSKQKIWSKQIYGDHSEDCYSTSDCFHVQEVMGVAGITVRMEMINDTKEPLVYTWTHEFEGIEKGRSFADRRPSKIRVWDGRNGRRVRKYSCDVGVDEDGANANPSIATVVFCRLFLDDCAWRDCMVVGLHCLGPCLQWSNDYSNFYLEQAQSLGEGSILPFCLEDHRRLESWRGTGEIVKVMTVVPEKNLLLSYSMRAGTGYSDALIVWSLEEPGIPLCRYDFWDPKRSLFKQQRSRLLEVTGLAFSHPSDIFVACEDSDRVAIMELLEDEESEYTLQVKGYCNIGNKFHEDLGFHGRMATFGGYAILANESAKEAWIFNVNKSISEDHLDHRDGNPRDFRYDYGRSENDEEYDIRRYAARAVAVGKLSLPEWGGSQPRKRRKRSSLAFSSELLFEEDRESPDKKRLGQGGPIAVAIRGRYAVVGFSNGTILRAPVLPPSFAPGLDSDVHPEGSTSFSCCSSLPSCDWFLPVLEEMYD